MTPWILLGVLLALFVYGWFTVPKGKLTKIVTMIEGTLTALYASLSESWYFLQDLVPEKMAWVFAVFFVGMTFAAAVRKK